MSADICNKAEGVDVDVHMLVDNKDPDTVVGYRSIVDNMPCKSLGHLKLNSR